MKHPQSQFREDEFRLIKALQSGKESLGVIGRDAGRSLQRLPSEIYWGAIGRWGIAEPGFSTRRYFECELLRREELKATPRAEDPEAQVRLAPTGIDPLLPSSPEDLLRKTTFAHRPESWTDESTQPVSVGYPAIRQSLSPELDALVDRASRFALYAQGASLLYNLPGRRLSATTKDFVGTWADAVAAASTAADLTGSDQLRSMITDREREKKGLRARLSPGNQLALDTWGGASGTSRFDYLWPNARRHLQDLYDAEEAP